MTGQAVISALKLWICLRKLQALRKTKSLMKDMEFECICAKIFEGSYDPADISPDLDNIFYEKFGMSCCDIVSAIDIMT